MSLSIANKSDISITLSLYINSKLEQYFPNDPYSDITIIFCSKNYKLQKAYLRLESDYFSENFESESSSNKLLLIGKKFEISLFEKILRCFYGGKAIIYLNEIYSAFEICHYLRSSSLVAQMVEQLVKNFENLNFFMVYSIGYIYSNDELLEKCFNFLKETNFKAMMEEWVYASKPNNKYPNSIYALSEDSFKNLIKMHNQLKMNSSRVLGFLSYIEIYNIIKTYVISINQTKSDQTNKLKELVLELIDKNQLNSKEYKLIYHQELFLLDEEKTNISNNDSINYLPNKSENQKYLKTAADSSKLDLITSENFLFRKEMEELRNDNSILLEELKILKENFRKSQHNLTQYEEKYNELVNKFNEVKNEINNNQMKSEMRFYTLEMVVEDLRTEISNFLKPNSEFNNFQRTSSDKTTPYSTKFKQRYSTTNPINSRYNNPLNRKSTEETKASKNDHLSFHSKDEKKEVVKIIDNKINVGNELAKHSLSAESFLVAKNLLNFDDKPTPTYSILKQRTADKVSNETPINRKSKNIEEMMKKLNINENDNAQIVKINDLNKHKEVKNIDDIMQKICLETKPDELTQESFFFIEKHPNKDLLNNTMISNYSEIINPSLLAVNFNNYTINYKNTVMLDVKSVLPLDDPDYETLKKWFDIKLYQKLKLHMLFKGSKDGFNIINLKEKIIEDNTPRIIFFNTKEFNNEVFGGFVGMHSNQGFAFEIKNKVRYDYSICEKEEIEYFISFGEYIRIFNKCNEHNRNLMKGELMKLDDGDDIKFIVTELEIYQILIDSEMDL